MSVVVVPASDYRVMPWKNGRGSTTELCTDRSCRSGVHDAGWSWRLSIADVAEPGPFSKFDGVDRLIACVSGEGMRVRVDGLWHDVPTLGAALAFRGESACDGAPIGAGVRDVNLMTRRGEWAAAMAIVRLGDETPFRWSSFARASVDCTCIVHALDAPVEVGHLDRYLALGEGETAVVHGATPSLKGPAALRAGPRAVVAILQPLDAARVATRSSGT